MTHRRIRPFNTRDTYPEQGLDNDLCQAVVAGNLVFLRGQVGQDLDTAASVGHGDAAAQAERAMANIGQLLAEAGARLEDICRVTIYLTDIRYREEVYRVIGRHLSGVFPVSTGVVVTALARPEWLVEVEATAVIPDDREPGA
jgi:enamine deaminase RidA (YjgF/YER057c/UK114 family)